MTRLLVVAAHTHSQPEETPPHTHTCWKLSNNPVEPKEIFLVCEFIYSREETEGLTFKTHTYFTLNVVLIELQYENRQMM